MSVRRSILMGALSLAMACGMGALNPATSRAETWPPAPQPYQGTWNVDYTNWDDTLTMTYGLTLTVSVPEYAPGHYPTMTEVCNTGTVARSVGFDNWATTGPQDYDTWFINPALPAPYWAGWPITPLNLAPGTCVTKFITAAREPVIVHFIHPVTGKRYDVLPATEWEGIPKVGWPRSYGSTLVDGDMTSDRRPDVLGVTTAGAVLTYTSSGVPGLSLVGAPTNAPPGCCIDLITKIPDLDRNGMTDYLWRGAGTKALVVQPVMGRNRFGQPRIVGTHWGGISLIAVVPDVTGDRQPELFGRAADGRLLRYTLNRQGPITGPTVVGTNWNGIAKLFSVGDASGDGIADLLAIHTDGRLLRYTLTASGRIGTVTQIGRGWGSMGLVAAPGDLDGNGRADLIAIRSDGKLFTYNHRGGGVFGAAVQIGQGWGGMKLIA